MSEVSASSIVEDEDFIKTKFDKRFEEGYLVDICTEFLEVDRPVPLMVMYFYGEERLALLTSGPYDIDTKWRRLFEMISVFSSLNIYECMGLIAMDNQIMHNGTLKNAIVITVLSRWGTESVVYPYERVDGKVILDLGVSAEDCEDGPYPSHVGSSLATYAFSTKGFGECSDVLRWLHSKGVGVQFFGDWNFNTIDARMYLETSELES